MDRRRRNRTRPGTPALGDSESADAGDPAQTKPRRIRSRDNRRARRGNSGPSAAAAAAAVDEQNQTVRMTHGDPRRMDDRLQDDSRPLRDDEASALFVLADPPPALPHSALPYPDFVDEYANDPEEDLAVDSQVSLSRTDVGKTITPVADAADEEEEKSENEGETAGSSTQHMMQHGPSVSFPPHSAIRESVEQTSQSGSGDSGSRSGSNGSRSESPRDRSATAHESNGALSTSSGPSPESSTYRIASALAVRMPDRPRSPLVGRTRIGGPSSPSSHSTPVQHSVSQHSPRLKEEHEIVPQPSGPPLVGQPPGPASMRPSPLAVQPVSVQPLDVEHVQQQLPAQYVHSAQPTFQSSQQQQGQRVDVQPGRASSPMRKFGLRAGRGSAAQSPQRKGPRSRRRAGRDDAGSAIRQQMQNEFLQQRPEEDTVPRRHMPSIRLARDVATINEALRESTSSVDKAETVLMALAKFAIAPKNPNVIAERRDALIEAGTIDLMVEVQVCHAASAPVQAMAAWAIGSMCHEDPSMQAAFGRAKGVEAVVASLRNHDGSLWVIEFGLRALSALTWEPQNRETIGMCGGLEVVISTMGRHADMCTVQADGATLLANSAYGHEQNKVLLANSFGLDAIVTAMRGFTHDATMQNHGCLAIRNLTWGLDQNKEIAGVKGGVNAVIDALDTHIGDAAVVEQGAAALRIMVEKIPSNLERMLNSSDWIAVLLNTLQTYPDTESVQVDLLTVLAEAVAVHSDKVPALITAGALDVALAGMRRNITRRAVMHAGAHAARALLATGAPEAEAALRGAGGIGTLLDMLYCSVTAPPPAVPSGARSRGSPALTPRRGLRETDRGRRSSAGVAVGPERVPSGAGPGPGTSSGHRDRHSVRGVAAAQNRAVTWV